MASSVLSCERSERALETPFVSARGAWTTRAALAVELRGEQGAGRGEASPLPGYSPDDIDGCERALGSIRALDELASLASPGAIFDWVDAHVPETLPAARFALQTAALDRLGQTLALPLWRMLRDTGADRASETEPALHLAAVLPSEDAVAALDTARRRFERGVRAFKLKVGPERLQPAQERTLRALRTEFGATVELRVDANQSLARAELTATFERLAACAVSFVEEPLAGAEPAELAALPCGFALDESLAGASVENVRRFVELDACRALVLKPTLLGGFDRCLRLAQLARSHHKSAIASHALEGPVAFTACVHLALALPAGVRHGLWPLSHQLPASGSRGAGIARIEGSGLGAPL